MKLMTAVAAVLLLTGAVLADAPDTQPEKLVVDVSVFEPCVVKTASGYTGFEIDLWEAIAKEIGVNFQYEEVPFERVFSDMKGGKAAVAIAGITINAERSDFMDFSRHHLDTGLQIVIPAAQTPPSKWDSHLISFLVAVICASFFLALLLTKSRNMVGVVILEIVLLAGILLSMSFFVAELTASKINVGSKTALSINGPEDLRGKTVGTAAGTTSVSSLKKYKATVMEFKTIEEAYAALLDGKLDAVVYDSPNVLAFIKQNPGKVVGVDGIFEVQSYGFGFQQDSPLVRRVSKALDKLRSNGTYDAIYDRWF